MKARNILLGAAAAVAFVPALSLPASASRLPTGQVAMNTNCASVATAKYWANGQKANWKNKCRPSSTLKLYISAPFQDNGVTVVSLWWTAPAGATSFDLIVNENTAAGPYSFTATGLPQSDAKHAVHSSGRGRYDAVQCQLPGNGQQGRRLEHSQLPVSI